MPSTGERPGSSERTALSVGRPVEVFTWPPKPAVPDPADRDPARDASWGREDVPDADGVNEPCTPELVHSPAHPPLPRWRDWHAWLRETEHAWLGVTGVAWHEGAARAGWLPDEPDAYCPRCATSAGPFEADADGCPACRGRRLPWSRAVRLGSYEGVLRDAVLAGKFTAWRAVCQELGADLGLAVASALGRAGVDPASVAVCPVPTSTRRRLARGVDHTAILAREVARATGGTLVGALSRRHRAPQAGLSASARKRNVAGSFRARRGVLGGLLRGPEGSLGGRVVVLVDDVRTTGATLSAASRALRDATRGLEGKPGEIWAAVAGVTPRRGPESGVVLGFGGSKRGESARSVKIDEPVS